MDTDGALRPRQGALHRGSLVGARASLTARREAFWEKDAALFPFALNVYLAGFFSNVSMI